MSDGAAMVIPKTPLHARTAPLCTRDMWVRACGFAVPAVYASEAEESAALAVRAAITDISARYCWRFDGPDAGDFLGFAIAHDASAIGVGQAARVLWCDDTGFLRGEGSLARLAETSFELTSLVPDFAWFVDGSSGFDVKVADWTALRGGIGLRGPFAEEILRLAGFVGPAMAERGRHEPSSGAPVWRQAQVLLQRSGDGFELWMDAAGLCNAWDRLMRVGAGFGLTPVGAKALDQARVVAAIAEPFSDWTPASFARRSSDLRMPRDLGVDPNLMRRFNGRDALMLRSHGCGSRLVQIRGPRPITQGDVIAKGGSAGWVTSVASPLATGRHLALAWIRDEFSAPGTALGYPGTQGALELQVVRSCFS